MRNNTNGCRTSAKLPPVFRSCPPSLLLNHDVPVMNLSMKLSFTVRISLFTMGWSSLSKCVFCLYCREERDRKARQRKTREANSQYGTVNRYGARSGPWVAQHPKRLSGATLLLSKKQHMRVVSNTGVGHITSISNTIPDILQHWWCPSRQILQAHQNLAPRKQATNGFAA